MAGFAILALFGSDLAGIRSPLVFLAYFFAIVAVFGSDPAVIRSPVVLSSLANGSLKRYSSSNGQK